jgi:hypothetical protein
MAKEKKTACPCHFCGKIAENPRLTHDREGDKYKSVWACWSCRIDFGWRLHGKREIEMVIEAARKAIVERGDIEMLTCIHNPEDCGGPVEECDDGELRCDAHADGYYSGLEHEEVI